MGLRNLEIDICYDPDGGRYAKPYGMQIMEMNGCKYAPYDTSGLMNTPASKYFIYRILIFELHALLCKNA
jgi:hypothetical protein